MSVKELWIILYILDSKILIIQSLFLNMSIVDILAPPFFSPNCSKEETQGSIISGKKADE